MNQETDCTDLKLCFLNCGQIIEDCTKQLTFNMTFTDQNSKDYYSSMCSVNKNDLAAIEVARYKQDIPQLEELLKGKIQGKLTTLCVDPRECEKPDNVEFKRHCESLFGKPEGICSPIAAVNFEVLLKQIQTLCQKEPNLSKRFDDLVEKAIKENQTPKGKMYMLTEEFQAKKEDFSRWEAMKRNLIKAYKARVLEQKQYKCDCLKAFPEKSKDPNTKTVFVFQRSTEKENIQWLENGKKIMIDSCKKYCPKGVELTERWELFEETKDRIERSKNEPVKLKEKGMGTSQIIKIDGKVSRLGVKVPSKNQKKSKKVKRVSSFKRGHKESKNARGSKKRRVDNDKILQDIEKMIKELSKEISEAQKK